MHTLKWVMARLRGPHATRTVILVALVLVLPSLFSGFFIDEYVQAARWKGSLGSFLDGCFVFGRGDPASNQRELLHELGAWWTAPDFKIAFWRPVAAVTHAIDLFLWPRSAVLMHLHTLVWFLGLLCAANALYRRLHTPRVATLALALYAWDDARGQVLSWIAKRNALIAAVFGLCAIIAHDKWRRDGWRAGAWLAPLFLAVGLFSGEMAIATTGFLFAHALCLEEGSYVRRMARMLPYLAVVVAWRALYTARGYGVEATIGYIDPLRQPIAYAANLFKSAPFLSVGQLTPIASDFSGLYPPPAKLALALFFLAGLVLLLRMAWPRLSAEPGQGRFWLISAGLSLLPICATSPQDQNLVFVGLGVAPALATVFASVVDDGAAALRHRRVLGTLAVFNLAVAPLLLPIKCLTMLGMGYAIPRTDQSITKDPAIAQKTLVVVWVVSEGGLYASWNHRDAEGLPKPRSTRILATSLSDVTITRPDEVTLRLRPEKGFLDQEMHRMMRPPSRPFHEGETVELVDMTARVTEITDDDRPKTVEFRFATPLESPEWLWMRGQGFGMVDFTPPRIGESVVVHAAF